MAGLKQKILATINLIFLLSVPSQCLNIKVHKDRELHETSPLLYGYTFEEANGAGDGGVLGQFLRDSGFQGDEPSLDAYEAIGNVELTVDTENPLSNAIPNSLAVTVLSDTEDVGFSNLGYSAIDPDDGDFTTGFYMKGDYQGSISIKLVGNSEGALRGSTSLRVNSTASEFRYFETLLPVTEASYPAHWELTFDGSLSAGETFYFDLVQLWAPREKNVPQFMDPFTFDIFTFINPSFIHFPGGNNLLGNATDTRWKWNETIGDLKDRPGRESAFGSPTSDALGLAEYFEWCKAGKTVPVLALYAGLSLGGEEGDVITGANLTPYIEDAMNELEYILGSASTKFGALRGSHGYPDPFPLEYVEVGYKDDLNNGGPSYPERFSAFYDAIHDAYPDLTIIASNMDYLPDPLPENTWVDFHIHSTPDEMVDNFDMWDSHDRNVPVVVGEYACTSRNDGTPLETADAQTSVAEAVFLIGLERNSDVVKMSSYGFTLQNYDEPQAVGPTLFGFTKKEASYSYSTSHYVQELFSTMRGNYILETTSDGEFGPIYWVASHTSTKYLVKMANYSPEPQTLSVEVEYSREGKFHFLAGLNATAHNSVIYEEDALIYPKFTKLETNDDYRYNITLTPWTVAVLETYAPS